MYTFTCSQKSVDIDSPRGFNKLAGDELAELLCSDPAYITWLEPEHLKKIKGYDIVTILAVHPSLLGHFYKRLLSKKITSKNHWDFLIKARPDFSVLNPYSDDEYRGNHV